MIKAKQAREMVDVRVKEELENRIKKANEFCETVIDNKIKERANDRFTSCEIEVDFDLRMDIVSILKDNGYTASALGCNKVSIIW